MPRLYNIPYSSGDKVGALMLIRHEVRGSGIHARRWWLCRCRCGTEKFIVQYSLKDCISCGCINRARRLAGFNKTHGMRRTPEYKTWRNMIRRCEDNKFDAYRYYGGRGIVVHPEWRSSFESFLRDVGPRPSSSHSLDRIDNNGHYEPGNVRWATRQEQIANRRTTVRVVLDGNTLTLADAARSLGISYKLAHVWMKRGKLALAVTYWDQEEFKARLKGA